MIEFGNWKWNIDIDNSYWIFFEREIDCAAVYVKNS